MGNAVASEKTHTREFSIVGYTKKEDYKETTILLDTQYYVDLKKLSAFFEECSSVIRAKGYLRTEIGWIFFNYTLSGIISEMCAEKERNELVIIANSVDSIAAQQRYENYFRDKRFFYNK